MTSNKPTEAILILAFNRPEKLKQLIANLGQVKPNRIYLAVDGPRSGSLSDEVNVAEVRKCVELLEWDCEIFTLFQEHNLGCRNAVIAALNWFFSNEDFGIVLEDDVLPDESFFDYVHQMRELYEHNLEVMHISGGLNSIKIVETEFDHYLSKFVNVWGWATWANRWKKFDLNEIKNSKPVELWKFYKHFESFVPAAWFQRYVWESRSPEATSWAVPWAYSIILRGGICVSPTSNLVFNTGFDESATHGVSSKFTPYSKIPISHWLPKQGKSGAVEGKSLDQERFKLIKITDPNLNIKALLRFYSKLIRLVVIPSRVNRLLSQFRRLLAGNL